jgi:nicotinate-nucleotide adenylyltransferase
VSAAAKAPAGPVGIYGGSFDPVHFGHLRTALELQHGLGLAGVLFIPSRRPPHRGAPRADADARVQMLQAALNGVPEFALDLRELQREGPSYTIDTLMSLREEAPERSLVLILGMDAFLGLLNWHRAAELPEYTHFIVAHRPGWQPPATGVLGEWLAARQTRTPDDLKAGAGRVFVHPVTALDISSTAIRNAVAAGGDPRFLVPEAVRVIIARTRCYNGPTGN